MAVPSVDTAQPSARLAQHGHPRLARQRGRVRVGDLHHAVRPGAEARVLARFRRYPQWGRLDLSRRRRRNDHLPARRPLLRDPGPPSRRRCAQRDRQSRCERGAGSRRGRSREDHSGGESEGGRRLRRSPRRATARGWQGRLGQLIARHECDDRRTRSGRGVVGRPRDRRNRQPHRPTACSRRLGGSKHATGANGSDRGRRATTQSESADFRGLGLLCLHPDRARARGRRHSGLVAGRCRARSGDRQRYRRAHHRLPVRARTRDPHRTHGGHRPRRPARNSRQRPGRPRGERCHRHGRAR